MSKGSKPRPMSVSQQQYDERWDLIFGRDQDKDEQRQKQEQALAEIVKFNQENGLYDLDDQPNPLIKR